MADIINLPNCGGVTGTLNTGIPFCDFIRKAPLALFLLDSGVEFDSTEAASVASFVTALKVASRAARGSRVYIIKDLTNFEDTSKEATKAAVGNLSIQEITMQEGIPSFSFQHRKGDLFHRQLSNAESAGVKLMILDASYQLYGTLTSSGKMTGFTLSEFKTELAKFATASEPSKYPFSVVLASLTEYKENLAIAQLDSTALSVSGNIDVTLTKSSQTTNVMNVIVTARGGKNLGTVYPTELAVVGAWTLKNTQTGASVTITSVTYNSTLGVYVVTADSTAYTALTSGQKLTLDLADSASLSALLVDGFESTGPVYFIKP